MKRFLITTADERTWKFDRPVIFLGEWCRFYDRKHIWQGMDAIVAEPYGLQNEQKEHDVAYIQALSMQLLGELTDALNAFHGTHHSSRYWEIVLGHWLQRYVSVTFNRYCALEQALNSYEVSGTMVFDSSTYSLATTDSMGFIWACNDDVWNHVLYSRILSYCWNVETEIDVECIRGVRGFVIKENSYVVRRVGTRRFILNALNKIQHKLSRKHDAFIVNSFLPLKEEIKLQLSLWQCPQLWRSPKTEAVVPDVEKRRSFFRIDAGNYQGFERLVRLMLCEVIPTCYLEGYTRLVQQVECLPWPSKPKFIFTSNNFDTDEIFKAWVGAKVEEGTPYFAGQHGNNYGTHVQHGNQYWPERAAADKFITWGWSDGNPKNVPAFVFSIAGRKLPPKKQGGLLLVELHVPHRIVPEDSYFEFGQYQEDQFRFVKALPENIQQQLTVRLYGGHKNFSWQEERRWKDRNSNILLDTGAANIRDILADSRLVVYSYDSTGLLETLALNFPTMCFWHGVLDHLLPSAKPFYDLLRDANILADTPEQAAEFIALHWDNIGEWWESTKVQDARKMFCDQYARTGKKPIRALKQLLTTHANQGSRK